MSIKSLLVTETINLRHGEITVSEANSVMGYKRLQLMEEAEKNPSDDIRVQSFRLLVYPALVSCSSGEVPTVEECIEEIPEVDLDKWYQVVKKLNPHWFSWENIDEKKKEN